ncbi:MAG: substrate-binding domain-containing protein [Methyloligellaceae bacterium]
MSSTLQLRTSNSTFPVLDILCRQFEKEQGIKVQIVVDTSKNSLARIEAGERGDIAVLLDSSIDQLSSDDILDKSSVRTFARSAIGMAVKNGSPKPDISTMKSFLDTLENAKSIAHTQFGPSGLYFTQLIDDLSLGDRIRSKTVTRPGGYIGRVVVENKAEMAWQQICELMMVPGLDVIGPIPKEVQKIIISKVGLFKDSQHQAEAYSLLSFFERDDLESTFKKTGLEVGPE